MTLLQNKKFWASESPVGKGGSESPVSKGGSESPVGKAGASFCEKMHSLFLETLRQLSCINNTFPQPDFKSFQYKIS